MAAIDAEEAHEARIDKSWTGPKFCLMGLVTLAISVAIIYYMSTLSGCSLQIVP